LLHRPSKRVCRSRRPSSSTSTTTRPPEAKQSKRSAKLRARVNDDAELWALRYKRSESLSTAGGLTLKTPPGTPGSVPAIYDDDMNIQDTNIVLWYIAHLSAYERVAAAGPWFKLEGYPDAPSMPHM
jgi:Cu2+-containing amine oxidase